MNRVLPFAGLALGVVLLACAVSARRDEPAWARVQVGRTEVLAEVADDGPSRSRGLSGRDVLQGGRGMLFVYDDAKERSFWMRDMRFALDVVWIREGRVVGISRDVSPPRAGEEPARMTSGAAADLALEVPAGTARRHGWGVDDVVSVRPAPRPSEASPAR